MTEPWIDHLVQTIKTTHHAAAEAAHREEEACRVIAATAPTFWRDVAEFLEKFVSQIRFGLQGDVTAGTLTCEVERQTQTISITKSAFPCVAWTAQPAFDTGKVTMRIMKATSCLPPSGALEDSIPCRFEVQGASRLIFQLNGHAYTEPEEAARWIIEKAFAQ